jgi:phosphatidylglycerol:prolipoprotein diacylglycerol transferase
LHPRLVQFGHIAIPTYGVFAALAIIAALATGTQIARRLSLDPNKIWNLGLIGIFTVLLGSRVLLILFHLSDFLAHPFWMLGIVTIRSNSVFYGSLLLAICACIGYIFANHLPLCRTLDCVAPAAALGLAIHGLGAFAAGSDYGSPTTAPWGMVYTHRLASLWSGTPLGVKLHPVQLYESGIMFLLFAVLIVLLIRDKQEGTSAGIFLFVYGAALYFLDFYRGERAFLFANSLSIAQLFGIVLVLTGAAFLMRTPGRQQSDGQRSSLLI